MMRLMLIDKENKPVVLKNVGDIVSLWPMLEIWADDGKHVFVQDEIESIFISMEEE